MPKHKILIVDDDELVRVSVAEGLRNAGFEVIEAADADRAQKALEVIKDVGLVFSDVRMPGSMDGAALAAWIANRYPGIKLLLTSGTNTLSSESHASELPLLLKPYRLRELVQLIGEMFRE